jgi:protein-disulfide isomerase
VLAAILNVVFLFLISQALQNDQKLYYDGAISAQGDSVYYGGPEVKGALETADDPFITRNPYLGEELKKPLINGDDPSLGARDAQVNIIMFSDFDCEFCSGQYQVIKKVLAGYYEDVRLIWKDYPETASDSRSWQASLAGRCAYEQDKFWQYYEYFLADPQGDFKKIAKKAGLNTSQFSKCLSAEETASRVLENVDEADSLGIFGVPYVFVNDRELLGEIKEEELLQLINLEIQGG